MSHFSLQQVISWGILAIIPGSLYGANGVVLINQNSAVAGGVTPDDTPGFPVIISEPGSYRLTGNLTVPDSNTTAIQITADSVTLDLNGFSIIGPGGCTTRPTVCPAPGHGVGVQAVGNQASGPRGVRVLNGAVRGMGLMGILLNGAGDFVEKVTANGNAGGGMSVAGSVIQSAAIQNGSFGIIASTVRDSTSLENVGDGILLEAGGIATGNVSSFNGGYGIWAPFSTATGNTTFLNTSFGISANCPSNIAGNTVVASDGGSGIETRGTGCLLVNNATRP